MVSWKRLTLGTRCEGSFGRERPEVIGAHQGLLAVGQTTVLYHVETADW